MPDEAARATGTDDARRSAEASRPTPRLFVAVPLTPEARGTIGALVDGVKAELARGTQEPRSEVRWVRMDGLHLTLRFLGATPGERIDGLVSAVDRAAAAAPAFDLGLGPAGAFPSVGRPRTLWIGIDSGSDELRQLAMTLAAELENHGWAPEERPFRAHLTLARADGRREGPAAARLLVERAKDLHVSFPGDRLVLFESITGSGAARYEPLHVAMLRAAS